MEEQCSAGKEIMALITRHKYSSSRPGRRSLCGLQSSERGYRGQNEANRSKMADGVLRWEHCALGCAIVMNEIIKGSTNIGEISKKV